MNHRRLLLVSAALLVLVGLVVAPTALYADAKTQNLAVSATVQANCSISTAPVAFGTYDPMTTTAVTATGGVTVYCTKAATVTVTLGGGSYASGAIRNMKTGTTGADSLAYELYSNNTYTTIWNMTNTQGYTSGSKNTAQTWPVYGRINALQDVTSGSYSDTVVATVNF